MFHDLAAVMWYENSCDSRWERSDWCCYYCGLLPPLLTGGNARCQKLVKIEMPFLSHSSFQTPVFYLQPCWRSVDLELRISKGFAIVCIQAAGGEWELGDHTFFLKALARKWHMTSSQVLSVRLVIWPGIPGNVVLHLVAASPKQLCNFITHGFCNKNTELCHMKWSLTSRLYYTEAHYIEAQWCYPIGLSSFPLLGAWRCFILRLVTSWPQVGCCMCPQTPRTKGNERPPPGNAPCASLSFIRKQKIFPETSLEVFLCISLARTVIWPLRTAMETGNSNVWEGD